MNQATPPLRAAIIPVTAFQQNCTLAVVHRDDARGVRRSGRRPAQAQGGGRAGRRDDREDPAHPRPYRPLRLGRDPRRRARRADRRPARGRPLLDRPAGRRRREIRHPREIVRKRPLAGRRRPGDRRRTDLRRPPLPRPHAWPRRLPPCPDRSSLWSATSCSRARSAAPISPAAITSNCSIRSPSACGRWAATPISSPATARCRPSPTNAPPTRSSATRRSAA